MDKMNEKNCYDCTEWDRGSEDGTCIHFINSDCRWGFSSEKINMNAFTYSTETKDDDLS